jgi:tRNA(fMet)-specific endonuclease VapC
VRLPKDFRFVGNEVVIKKSGNAVVLLPALNAWDTLTGSLGKFSDDFMDNRNQPATQSREDICISSVTLAELRYGVAKSQFKAKNQSALDEFILPLEVADFNEAASAVYGTLRADLEAKGTPIGALDTMIGAHALSLGLALVTNNTKEFNRVVGLKIVDWLAH